MKTKTNSTKQKSVVSASSTKSKNGKVATKAKTPKTTRIRLDVDGKRIVRLTKENPRRAGGKGYKSWNLLKKGMTYEQFIAAGGRHTDLAWDISHGNVKLINA